MNIYQQSEDVYNPVTIIVESTTEALAIVRAIESYRASLPASDFKATNMNILDPIHNFLVHH